MGHNKLIIVDTDILIDAGRNVNEALNCLHNKLNSVYLLPYPDPFSNNKDQAE
jgi:hypothetical protein